MAGRRARQIEAGWQVMCAYNYITLKAEAKCIQNAINRDKCASYRRSRYVIAFVVSIGGRMLSKASAVSKMLLRKLKKNLLKKF